MRRGGAAACGARREARGARREALARFPLGTFAPLRLCVKIEGGGGAAARGVRRTLFALLSITIKFPLQPAQKIFQEPGCSRHKVAAVMIDRIERRND